MTRRLIVNADDLGRSPGISRGIIEAAQRGIVRSTTLMVNLPWAADAVRQCRVVPGLGLGLHLSFCYGPPLVHDADSLLGPDGNLERDLDALRQRATPEDIARECRAQIAHFHALVGAPPSHLDSHQHVHSWPRLAETVADIAREQRLPVRACNPTHAALLCSRGIACPDTFIDTFFGAGRVGVDHLAAIMRALPDGISELMCHPGYDDAALSDSSYRLEREQELRTLCAPAVRAALADEGIELVTYHELHSETEQACSYQG